MLIQTPIFRFSSHEEKQDFTDLMDNESQSKEANIKNLSLQLL
jgi:hypothetical protein